MQGPWSYQQTHHRTTLENSGIQSTHPRPSPVLSKAFNICDHPWQNQPYCAQDRFWVKATITNYDLWTTDPANLKSLAPVGSEMWAKMYPDRPYYNFTASAMKHCYVRYTRKSVYSPFMPSTWPRPPSQWASWLPKRLNESSSQRFDGKERLDKHF